MDFIVKGLIGLLLLCLYLVPALSTKRLATLPLDLPEMITIHTKDNYSITINNEIATKIGYLNAMMDWNNNSKNEFYIDVNLQDFEWVIDYLNHPTKAKQEWTDPLLPHLVNIADYLIVHSMLKDSMRQLCFNVAFKTPDELDFLFLTMSESLSDALMHCINENSIPEWQLYEQVLQKRLLLQETCKLRRNFDINDLEMMNNPSVECCNYIKMNFLHYILPLKLIVDYDNLDDLNATGKHMKEMGLKVRLNGLCKKITSKSGSELESLFKNTDWKEYMNALFYCISDNPPLDWSLRDVALEKRREYLALCHSESVCGFTDSFIMNAKPKCLEYILKSDLRLIKSPYFGLFYSKLESFTASTHLLLNIDYETSLSLNEPDNLPQLFRALKLVPTLTFLRINCESRLPIDLSLFPNLSKLQTLDINHCQLSQLSQFLQKDFSELITLNLHENQMKNIGRIHSMPKLKTLNLSCNELIDISELLKSPLPKLDEINLRKNQIHTIQQIPFMPNLSKLNFDQNPIRDNSGLRASHLPKLRILNMNGDKL